MNPWHPARRAASAVPAGGPRRHPGAPARSGWFWLGILVMAMSGSLGSAAELKFPPPDFESGYAMPTTQYPAARWQGWEYLDVAVLLGCLAVATWLVYRTRSRRGIVGLSLFSLAYFGFVREGCVCAIGSVQNVALALGGGGYVLPVTVAVFFAAPLLVALFFGRTFCAAVCPHGALQDLVLVRAVRVPRWLESGLSVLPFLFLGAGVVFAATGAGFVICRYDPFVPIFRMNGGLGMVLTGIVLLGVGTFIGRPYCRFLCPYGALLKVAAMLSKWRLRVTPDVCTQCRLCPSACPFEAIEAPDAGWSKLRNGAATRRTLWIAIAALPLWMAAGGAVGWGFGRGAASVHPTVALALSRQEKAGAPETGTRPDRLALARAEREARELVPRAALLQQRMQTAGIAFGIWAGLVIGLKGISAGMVRRRDEFRPERTACVACARCFESCPQERVRLGLAPSPMPVSMPDALVIEGAAQGKGTCGGCAATGAPKGGTS